MLSTVQTLADPTSEPGRRFASDLSAALQTASTSNVARTRTTQSKEFGLWADFCDEVGVKSTLDDIPEVQDRLNYLVVFAYRYRQRPGRSQDNVRTGSISKILTAVGKGITDLGGQDPRFPYVGSKKYYPVLQDFMDALRKQDDPSSRTYPANVTVIRAVDEALDKEHATHGAMQVHIIDLIVVAFFWLMRPAEYTGDNLNRRDNARSESFLYRHIQFVIGKTVYPADAAPLNDANNIKLIEHAYLTFSDQKNAVKGEQIGHAATNDDFFCGAKALGRIVHRYLQHGAPPDTPICRHYNPADQSWYDIKSRHITNALRHGAELCRSTTGIDPALLSARSLRPGGATALMMADIDTDHICLMGRWKSDAMFRYLRIQAATNKRAFAQRMLDNGSYTFAPAAFQQGSALPQETPPALRAVLDLTSDDDSDIDSD